MIPPLWLNVKIGWFGMPLPIFLLWPLFVIAWIVLGIALTLALVVAGGNPAAFGKLWLTTWELVCALRGTSIDVEQAQFLVRIAIY